MSQATPLKVTLCGSIAHESELHRLKALLESYGFLVQMPPLEVPGPDGSLVPITDYYNYRKTAAADEAWVWRLKALAMYTHFFKIEWADLVIIVNPDKDGIGSYIGANTFGEMFIALAGHKPTLILNAIPSRQTDRYEEILGMWPQVLNGNPGRQEILQAYEAAKANPPYQPLALDIKRAEIMSVGSDIEYCNHTSVGAVIRDDHDWLLLINRAKPPYGYAPPAGHIDPVDLVITAGVPDLAETARRALIREVSEETGLTVTRLDWWDRSPVRVNNVCRRPEGTHHHWWVGHARVSGDLRRSLSETRSAHWTAPELVRQLAERTLEYKAGKISEDRWQERPGLEPVWLDFLQAEGIVRL